MKNKSKVFVVVEEVLRLSFEVKPENVISIKGYKPPKKYLMQKNVHDIFRLFLML